MASIFEDSAKYRSSEFDMFIPVEETTSSLLFWPTAFATTTAAVSIARTYVNVGMGYRRGEVNGWLLGVNTFLDADRYSPLTWRHLAGKFIKTVWLFRQLLFPHRLENVNGIWVIT
ncbi:inverse autotransporter beta domain-containing protein [Salmonella enterica subsp. enterica]|nr:inverse autotransporter beta domain-containing protein [Salmonella enterica subsp. enterica]